MHPHSMVHIVDGVAQKEFGKFLTSLSAFAALTTQIPKYTPHQTKKLSKSFVHNRETTPNTPRMPHDSVERRYRLPGTR